ncbi:MAG: MBL fold metallo-hydrolase [Betaproteobacteria bacterium]|nr:MAG: MBL fold metallo-hydrolase [Betaproteobacteria bacterium]
MMLVLLGVMMGGCAIRGLPATGGVVCPECGVTICDDRQTLSIEYLGSGGYLLTRGDDVLLLGPFISNSGVLEAMNLKRIEPDVDALEAWLPDVSNAKAIIVGHAHCDHLMDVPWIAKNRAKDAKIYVNRTGSHVLAADGELHDRVHPIDAAYWPGTKLRAALWVEIPRTRVRILPIESEHAPHFAGLKFMKGRLTEDQKELPKRARRWVEGRTYAFLIDFQHPEDDDVMFSVHYQDAASNPTLGFPPARDRRLDAALVCVASHHEVKDYPDDLLAQTQPRHVVLGHWENFFAPYTRDLDELRGVPFSRPQDFIERVERYVFSSTEASWSMPAPGAVLELVACPNG